MNKLEQTWPLPGGGSITITVVSAEPFTMQVWHEDLPAVARDLDNLRIHLGGDL
jgi:hypothetical protein